MAKKRLEWKVDSNDVLHGFTPKTHKEVFTYYLISELGSPDDVANEMDNHREISSGYLKNDPVYDFMWYQLEELGLAKVAVRTKQLMDTMCAWVLQYIKED